MAEDDDRPTAEVMNLCGKVLLRQVEVLGHAKAAPLPIAEKPKRFGGSKRRLSHFLVTGQAGQLLEYLLSPLLLLSQAFRMTLRLAPRRSGPFSPNITRGAGFWPERLDGIAGCQA